MPDVVVLGAGANGLASAITLLQRGYRVEVWTRDDPAATVSAVAAAVWYPFLAEPREAVLRWSATTFAVLQQLANEPATGVRMTRLIEGLPAGSADPWWTAALQHWERLPRERVPAPFAEAIALDVPVCDTSLHVPWLQRRVLELGGAIVSRTVHHLDEAVSVAGAVVNCTGLGAAELCQDDQLVAVRGQIVCIDPVEVPWALIDAAGEQPVYVVPRAHDIVIGGTAQSGDRRTAPDAHDTERILSAAAQRMPSLREARIRDVKVGLRPYRSAIRLECERRSDGSCVVHNYGHGGSGFTLNWGCAAEVATLLAAAGH